MSEPVAIAASPAADYLAVRRGDLLTLVAADSLEVVAEARLGTDDADLAFAGAPAQLLVLVRPPGRPPELRLYNPPSLEAVAGVEIPGPAHLVAITGPRAAIISGEPANLVVARCAPRAVTAQPADVGGQLDLVIGLDRNQLLLATPRRLEVWDAMSRRAMLRLNLTLPPPPRLGGAAEGHVWVAQPGGRAAYIYRMSDGRTYEQPLGGALRWAVSDASAPHVVFGTATGAVRLNVLTRSAMALELPATVAAALAGPRTGALLFGVSDDGVAWRLPLARDGAAPEKSGGPAEARPAEPAWPRPRPAARVAEPAPVEAPAAPPPIVIEPTRPRDPDADAPLSLDADAAWREQLARWASAALRGDRAPGDRDPPRAVGTPLTELDVELAPAARRVLALAYGAWLNGAPALALATAARAAGGEDAWPEVLANGALAARRWVTVADGRLALTRPVARCLDGAAPEHVAVLGLEPTPERVPGAHLAVIDAPVARALDGLAARLGRIAIAAPGADLDAATTEADLARATLVIPPRAARAAALAVWAHRHAGIILWVGPIPAALAALPRWQ